jgi:monoamine oxidase
VTISRRAALALLAAAPACAASSDPDVVIIGAGAAGIAAARTLATLHASFVMIEARDRIGGRAFTESRSLGAPFDHGAASMHSADRNPLTALAAAEGISVVPDDAPADLLYAGATRVPIEPAAAAFARLEALADAGQAALARRPRSSDPAVRAAEAWFGPLEHGVEIDALSASDVAGLIETGDERLSPLGFGTLIARLGAGLQVQLSTPATLIDWSRSGVSVTTPAGVIRARAAIITVPTGVLAAGAIRFSPALPLATQGAIEALRPGLLNKVGLSFAPGALEAKPFTDLTHVDAAGAVTAALLRPFATDTAVCFAGANLARALETDGPLAAIAYHLDRLVDVFGTKLRTAVRGSVATAWGGDPFAAGAYSAVRPGSPDARAMLAAPVGDRLVFAGEATGGAWATQVPGAWLSGEAAARTVRGWL